MQIAIKELDRAQRFLQQAKLVVIKSFDQAESAQKELANIKAIQKQVEEARVIEVKPLNDKVKAINEAFRKPKDFLEQAEQILKAAIKSFMDEEAIRVREQQAALARQARLEREQLESRADKAESSGQTEKAEALRETADNVVVSICANTSKLKGVSQKTTWKAKVTDKAAFCKAALERPDMLELLEIDVSKLNKLAQVFQKNLTMPGISVYPDVSISARAATGTDDSKPF